MAIFPSLPGITLSIITAEGVPFAEYTDTDGVTVGEDNNRVQKYIECSTDQEFGIRAVVDGSYIPTSPSIAFHVRIDGVFIAGHIFNLEYGSIERSMNNMRVLDGDKEKPFRFTTLNAFAGDHSKLTVDEQTQATHLGNIVVQLWRKGPAQRKEVPPRSRKGLQGSIQVNEVAIKGTAKSHTASLGEAKAVAPRNFLDALKLDSQPIAQVTFKYRSRASLQQLMVLPRTPEPESQASAARPTVSAAFPTVKLEPMSDPRVLPHIRMEDLDEENRLKVQAFMRNLMAPDTKPRIKSEENYIPPVTPKNKRKLDTPRDVSRVERERDANVGSGIHMQTPDTRPIIKSEDFFNPRLPVTPKNKRKLDTKLDQPSVKRERDTDTGLASRRRVIKSEPLDFVDLTDD